MTQDFYTDELEFKYRADAIKLADFRALMASQQPSKRQVVASWDVYYVQDSDGESFQRFRMDRDRPELTKKVKVKASNNWKRVESDLPLDPKRTTEAGVAFHVGLDGYRENFRIFKYCEIYHFDHVNYVYYVVYNDNMRELDRFVEVEVNKDKVPELESREVGLGMKVLRAGEATLESIGISAQNRLKKSLFELYKK